MSTPPGTPRPTGSPHLLDSPSPPASPVLPPGDGGNSPPDHSNALYVTSNSRQQRPALPAVLILSYEEYPASEPAHSLPRVVVDTLTSSAPVLLDEDSGSTFPLSAQEDSSSSVTILQNENSSHTVTGSVLNEDSNNALDVDSVSGLSVATNAVERRSASPGSEPPAKVRKISNSSDEADGESCPICLEPWGNAGDHRLVALKCGHLFGSKCVERWLRSATSRDRACPTCKSRATARDLRHIYARRLVAADTAELSALQQRVRDLQAEKHRVELELHRSKLATRACREEIEALKAAQRAAPAPAPTRRKWRFALEKNLEISREGGCRVLAYNSRSYELYVSQKSTSSLFPGWGVRKVSCVDYQPGQFQLLHPKPVRDAAYSSARDALLTVSLDGCAKVSERGQSAVSLSTGAPLWACAWDVDRDHQLYVGGVGGAVLHYDIRSPGSPLARLASPGRATPVVALQATPVGLLACRLDACLLWRPRAAQWTPETLPVEEAGQWTPEILPVKGPFMSMSYDAGSWRALLSCRPRAGVGGSLAVCRLQPAGPCVVEHTFPHGARAAVMCRAAWVSAGGVCWAAAHDESVAALRLYPVTGGAGASLPANEPALDVRGVDLSGETLLAALSDCRLRIYRATATDF